MWSCENGVVSVRICLRCCINGEVWEFLSCLFCSIDFIVGVLIVKNDGMILNGIFDI